MTKSCELRMASSVRNLRFRRTGISNYARGAAWEPEDFSLCFDGGSKLYVVNEGN
ncbi:MAG TPA: hypothetical protein VHT51_09765 [Micropepsaceae bacterium]|jgi:hypothetical protein|nr:hypothetical protein [Micropepsaceae bacterium]